MHVKKTYIIDSVKTINKSVTENCSSKIAITPI